MAHDEQDFVDGWQIYSDWIDNIRDESDLITDYDEDIHFQAELLGRRSNFERFKFIWENNELRAEVEQFYKTDLEDILRVRRSRQLKSTSESKKKRELGNKSFKDGDYLQAVVYYTQAITYAPYPEKSDDSLALALANRSAALYSLTRYRFCLADIDLAIKFGYPQANLFKLLIRKVKCLHILSIWANDIEDIKSKLKQMSKSSETKEFIRTEINNMFEFLETSRPEDMEKDELDMEDETVVKILNASKSLPNAADCVEMSYEQDKGRYLLANRDASFGRLLVAEEPFVCNLAPSRLMHYCYNCFSRLHSCGLACENCTQILYCSIECLKANSNIHSNECNGLLDFQPKIGVAYLVAHLMFKIDFKPNSIPLYGKKTIEYKSLDDVLSIHASNWPDLVYKNDYAAVVSLMDHFEDFEYDSIMGFTLTAVYLLIAFMDHFPNKIPRTDNQLQLVIGSLILRHLLQLQTNLISVLDQNLQSLTFVGHSLSEMQEKPIGIALYPTVSLLNHSCSPNVLSIFHKNKFCARASRSLECGTEISYCYGPSVTRMSKVDRQNRLKEQYFFTCECECCAKNKENECRALVCNECSGPVIYDRDLTNRCLKCLVENPLNVKDILRKVENYKRELDRLTLKIYTDSNKLLDIERELTKLVYWRNPLFVQIKAQLISCAENNDDSRMALKYCKEELLLSDKTYGENSLESILTKLKYINLDWQRIKKSARDVSKEGLVKEFKDLHSTVQLTRGKLKDLLNSTTILGAEKSFDEELKFLSDMYANISKQISVLEGGNDDGDDGAQSPTANALASETLQS